jgi:glutamine amidotransferase
MHNGFLGDFSQWRRELLGSLSDNAFNLIQGNTDSEHVFAMFMDEVGFNSEASAAIGAAELLKALNNCIKKLIQIKSNAGCNAQAHMNFAVSNGHVSLFSRLSIDAGEPPPTLHYLIDEASCVVASEPLSDSSDWQEVDQGQVLVLEKESGLRIEEISL